MKKYKKAIGITMIALAFMGIIAVMINDIGVAQAFTAIVIAIGVVSFLAVAVLLIMD